MPYLYHAQAFKGLREMYHEEWKVVDGPSEAVAGLMEGLDASQVNCVVLHRLGTWDAERACAQVGDSGG